MRSCTTVDGLKQIAAEVAGKGKRNLVTNDVIVKSIYGAAENIASSVVSKEGYPKDWDTRLDDIFTSKLFGFPSMAFLLGLIFWITIVGANVPSELLATFFTWGQGQLTTLCQWLGAPVWVHGFFVEGIYLCLTWVIAVMLPPMAIFFPCFALLEDLGYLPRVAFNLDRLFKKAGVHGKQALTMSMGFGCNAAGVIACRIIESPRERLIAMLTNVFVPCNGRFAQPAKEK